jgi:hypothetical protein
MSPRVPNASKELITPKDMHHSSKFLPLWHQVSSHPEAATEEDIMAEGDRTMVVELELGSSDKNDL